VKIDIFCHILPQAYFDRMTRMAGRGAYMQKRVREIPVLLDLDQRFRVMDEFGDYRQVFSLATPSIEAIAGPELYPICPTSIFGITWSPKIASGRGLSSAPSLIINPAPPISPAGGPSSAGWKINFTVPLI
jgi:hypothetical protein